METKTKANQVELGVGAPCGLYCSDCPSGQNGTSHPISCTAEHCPSHLEGRICEIYQCCVVKYGLNDCSDCPEFPCNMLLQFSHNVNHPERVPAILNLQRRKLLGMKRWLEQERLFWEAEKKSHQWALLQQALQERRQYHSEIRVRIAELTTEVEMARLYMDQTPLPQHA